MRRDAEATRLKLLDAATNLFAERGIHAVSIAEITKAAGQRNPSALHYHFGGREALLEAIVRRHAPIIRDRRVELLAYARATDRSDVRSVVEALVRPLAEFVQRGWRERAFVRVGVELATGPDRASPQIMSALEATGGYEVLDLFAERFPDQPDDVRLERFKTAGFFVGRATADRARLLESRSEGEEMLTDAAFVSNLIDMTIGMLTSPVTPLCDRSVTKRTAMVATERVERR
jgi:AcrR family transcriptional regulator